MSIYTATPVSARVAEMRHTLIDLDPDSLTPRFAYLMKSRKEDK